MSNVSRFGSFNSLRRAGPPRYPFADLSPQAEVSKYQLTSRAEEQDLERHGILRASEMLWLNVDCRPFVCSIE